MFSQFAFDPHWSVISWYWAFKCRTLRNAFNCSFTSRLPGGTSVKRPVKKHWLITPVFLGSQISGFQTELQNALSQVIGASVTITSITNEAGGVKISFQLPASSSASLGHSSFQSSVLTAFQNIPSIGGVFTTAPASATFRVAFNGMTGTFHSRNKVFTFGLI